MFDSCLFVTDKEWGIIIILVNFVGGGGGGFIIFCKFGEEFLNFF